MIKAKTWTVGKRKSLNPSTLRSNGGSWNSQGEMVWLEDIPIELAL